MKQTHKYYDGIPRWIKNLTKEELEKGLKKKKKDLLNLTLTRNRQQKYQGRNFRPFVLY